MEFKNLRVYYLEDDKGTFAKVKQELIMEGITVYPKTGEDWSKEIVFAQQFLTNTGEAKTKNAADFKKELLRYDFDLFILDVYLVANDEQYRSTEIYKDIFKTDPKLSKLPVIFLTRLKDDSSLPLGSNAEYVNRPDTLTDENINQTIKDIKEAMQEFPSVLDRINADSDTFSNATPSTFTNWIRQNF